jgi:hypothetical protein
MGKVYLGGRGKRWKLRIIFKKNSSEEPKKELLQYLLFCIILDMYVIFGYFGYKEPDH